MSKSRLLLILLTMAFIEQKIKSSLSILSFMVCASGVLAVDSQTLGHLGFQQCYFQGILQLNFKLKAVILFKLICVCVRFVSRFFVFFFFACENCTVCWKNKQPIISTLCSCCAFVRSYWLFYVSLFLSCLVCSIDLLFFC